MSFFLPFEESFCYSDHPDGIVIPVSLQSGSSSHLSRAVVDCGASVCLFSREIGELLKLNLEQGDYKRLRTLAGGLGAFGHEVSLKTFELVVDSIVYFARDYGLPRNLLGRQGWLNKLRFGLVWFG